MVALVIVSTFVVLVLGVLVAGLLRSHADILRALHDLGAGVGDPTADGPSAFGPAPVTMSAPHTSPALGAAPAVAGLTPTGDARAIAVANSDDFTLLGFLSSGCTGCAAFWNALQEPDRLQLPDHTRVVIVTKGSDREIPSEVRALTTGRIPVVMSTEAWLEYEVPGSPFFVLVDGASGQKVGQGVASSVRQLSELVRRAEHDRTTAPGGAGGRGRGETSLGGPARDAAADDVLAAAGILPGDPSLYPRTLDDVFPHARTVPAEHTVPAE
jgi:hypothetical protein